jgi:hypothetical protein
VLSLSLARRNASTLAAAAALACLTPATTRSALASAAGLVLEAAPLVIAAAGVAALIRSLGPRRVRLQGLSEWLGALAGCGCSALPGALSLPAAGLAWYAFGPAVAAARFVVGCGIAVLSSRGGRAHEFEPLDRLGSIVPYALLGSLASEALRSFAPWAAGSGLPAFAGGVLVGVLSPCALGAIAVAAALSHAAPYAALGIVSSAGLVRTAGDEASAVLRTDSRIGYGLLALAGIGLVALGGAGLVHPRLSTLVLVAATLGIAATWRGPRRSASLLAPLLAAVALVLGSPVPPYGLAEATSADAFVGEPVRFTGVIEHRAQTTLLVRFTITCCRADASPVALRLDRTTPLNDGSWATVEGVFRLGRDGLVVHVLQLQPAKQPRDPFLYR